MPLAGAATASGVTGIGVDDVAVTDPVTTVAVAVPLPTVTLAVTSSPAKLPVQPVTTRSVVADMRWGSWPTDEPAISTPAPPGKTARPMASLVADANARSASTVPLAPSSRAASMRGPSVPRTTTLPPGSAVMPPAYSASAVPIVFCQTMVPAGARATAHRSDIPAPDDAVRPLIRNDPAGPGAIPTMPSSPAPPMV